MSAEIIKIAPYLVAKHCDVDAAAIAESLKPKQYRLGPNLYKEMEADGRIQPRGQEARHARHSSDLRSAISSLMGDVGPKETAIFLRTIAHEMDGKW
jgi:hypothetical protein